MGTQADIAYRMLLGLVLAEQGYRQALESCQQQQKALLQTALRETVLTKKVLAKKLGVTPVYLSHLLHGRAWASVQVLRRLWQVFLEAGV
jgi:transcriptional regulator with XRE-family HTH domain